MTTATHRVDVAIIGGAIIGSATACFLKLLAPSLSVTVIEPDPTYEWCSTLRASGGARRLFSCSENIEMSNFSIDFIKAFPQAMAANGREAPVDWVEGGYLFIVPPAEWGCSNLPVQRAHGCDVHLLSPAELKASWPSMHVDDLAGGVHSPGDGWCDPNGLLQGFRRKALSLGVEYVKDRVISLAVSGHAIQTAGLESGASLAADLFVNAAGAWSGMVADMAGVPLPVSPLRRFEHYFTCGNPIERLPYVKDLDRMAFRPRAPVFPVAWSMATRRAASISMSIMTISSGVVWPAAAHRFPPLESAACPHLGWPVRAVRTRRQPGDRLLFAGQFLYRRRLFRPRHDARAGSGTRHRGTDRQRPVRVDRPDAARL
jgi:glycine/D-amino acid oxidase-like deaminating enzyme